jgi:hypothetical protein
MKTGEEVERRLAEMMLAGLSREQAMEAMRRQAEHDAKRVKPRKRTKGNEVRRQ